MRKIYLNAVDRDGNRSEGPAVLALQIFLLGNVAGRSGYVSIALRPTGIYDDATTIEVSFLQIRLGFEDKDVDGFCGPGTRQQIKERLGVDLEAIFAQMQGPGRYAQPDGTMLELEHWLELG